MANDLTGDFDVVAEFTLGAANRVLAAMHSGGRVPHSWSLRVDDFTHVKIRFYPGTVPAGVRVAVDAFGQALTNPAAVAQIPVSGSSVSGRSPVNLNVDVPVNTPTVPPVAAGGRSGTTQHWNVGSHLGDEPLGGVAAAALAKAEHLVGVAQLQMGAPTVSVAPNSSNKVVIHTPVMAYYIEDPGTMYIPNFLRGEFQTTIAVQEVSSGAGKFIKVLLAGKAGNAQFVPNWVSPAWDSKPDQLAAINKALTNSLTSSFEPSTTPVPANVLDLKFKALADGPALAMLMDLPGGNPSGPPNAASMNTVFLGDGDDFAFAISEEFVQTMFASSLSGLKRMTFSFAYQFSIKVWNPLSWVGIGDDDYTIKVITVTFNVSLDSVSIELQNGQILVTVTGTANTDTSGIPKFTFTASQALTLELINSVWGSTADLVTSGDPTVDASAAGIPDWAIDNYFKPTATSSFKNAIANFLAQVNPGLQKKLSARESLGNFLTSMMNPTPKPGDVQVDKITPTLTYTSFEISPAGIVLHGTLALSRWHKPHVEFSFRMVSGVGPFPIGHGEYNALRSWIPGGTIEEFIWHQQDGPTLDDDKHRFLFEEVKGAGQLIHLCLTVKGRRITAGGPVSYEAVTAESFCSWRMRFITTQVEGRAARAGLPKIALTRKSERGGLQVVGHTSTWAPPGTPPEYSSNLLVHFADQDSLRKLESFTEALKESGHGDNGTAILAVVEPEHFANVGASANIQFADDVHAWSEYLEVKHRPATAILDSAGNVAWKHDGPVSQSELAAALKKHLTAGADPPVALLTPGLVVGQVPPNFQFQSAPDHELTLRRLIGHEVVIVFWHPRLSASIEMLREIERALANAAEKPVVLAVNDGEDESGRRGTPEARGAIMVSDSTRDVARAYGISIWPTVVNVDANGLISGVRIGRLSAPPAASSRQAS